MPKLLSLLRVAGASAAFVVWSSAYAQAPNPPADESPEASLTAAPEQALANPSLPQIPSFQRGSATHAGGPANELNTGDDRAERKLPGGSAADAITGADLYHGNYCGRGDRGPGAPPMDELDAACMRHDACYDQRGDRSCACDKQLGQEAVAVSNMKSLSRELRARAAAVAEAASLMGCNKP
jgi:hypothetical protein